MGPTNQPQRVPMNRCWEPSSLFAVFLRDGRQLHKTFQAPSVRHVYFIRGVFDLHNYFHATFRRMFPNLNTRPNRPFQCFKERGCKEIEHDALACSRKRVLLNDRPGWTNEMYPSMANFGRIFLQLEDVMQ